MRGENFWHCLLGRSPLLRAPPPLIGHDPAACVASAPCRPVEPNESLIWRISEFIIIKITRCLQCCLSPVVVVLVICIIYGLRNLVLATFAFDSALDANFSVFGRGIHQLFA